MLPRLTPCAIVLVLAGASGVAEDVFVDTFTEPLAGRWEAVQGTWRVDQGRLVHPNIDFPDHDMLLAGFPFSEGKIEVTAIAREASAKYGFASIGLVARYLDEQKRIYFRFGSYNKVKVDGAAPGFMAFNLGRGGPDLDRAYALTLVVRNGVIGVCVDDTMIGVLRDPLAGRTCRAGLFTETGATFDDVRITRYAP